MVCYINPTTPVDLTKPLYEIQTVTRKAVTRTDGNTTLFPMSNSVYYGSNDGEIAPTIAVPINADQLFDSKDAALAATDKTIEVFVERYAAKLAFSHIKLSIRVIFLMKNGRIYIRCNLGIFSSEICLSS